MAAQAFLLIASFLLVLFILARPLGTLLAKMIVGASLPGVSTLETGLLADDGD
jgi:K+-transporting ATPase ATPase A chain